MRVLLVSPSHPEGNWIHQALEECAYSVQRTHCIPDGLFCAAETAFDVLVIVAIEASKFNLLADALPQFHRLIRGAVTVTVLGSNSVTDRVATLRAGADVCFHQPYSFEEMRVRIEALRRISLSRDPGTNNEGMGPWLDSSRRELVEGRNRLSLTKREYLIVECLIRKVNFPTERAGIVRYAWPKDDEVEPSSLNLVVTRLRRKIEHSHMKTQIETVNRFGYRLVAPPVPRVSEVG
jgi:two-component system OmpR family response regulator